MLRNDILYADTYAPLTPMTITINGGTIYRAESYESGGLGKVVSDTTPTVPLF
jgi:hypothetical protein